MSTETKIILLADYDVEDQEILEEEIVRISPVITVHAVMNGYQAIDYLNKCTDNELPSLIVLDYKMPVLNATEVLEHLAKMPRVVPIPKVVWSSSNQPEHVKRCLDRGAINYFVKPNNSAGLTNIVEQMIFYMQ